MKENVYNNILTIIIILEKIFHYIKNIINIMINYLFMKN